MPEFPVGSYAWFRLGKPNDHWLKRNLHLVEVYEVRADERLIYDHMRPADEPPYWVPVEELNPAKQEEYDELLERRKLFRRYDEREAVHG